MPTFLRDAYQLLFASIDDHQWRFDLLDEVSSRTWSPEIRKKLHQWRKDVDANMPRPR